MKFQFTKLKLAELDVDLVAVQIFETSDKQITFQKTDGGTDLDKALDGALTKLLQAKGFAGKEGESYLLPTFCKIKPRYVLILGAGTKKSFSLESLRKNAGRIVTVANEYKAKSAAGVIETKTVGGSAAPERVRAFAEGIEIASYNFDQYKSKKEKLPTLTTIHLVSGGNTKPLQAAVEQASAVAAGVNFARLLTDLPPNVLNPTTFGKRIAENCKGKGITCKILGLKEIKAEKMGGILAVSQGSLEPPAFIHLHYKPTKKSKTKIALVGKGITFDSGGLNIKVREMEAMKCDMAGAASVAGTFLAMARLQPDVEVHGFIASSENLPSGTAFRPSDIITMRSGKTVEILNTDAEGRLVLADALDYSLQFKPDFIIDAATLTGGVLYALGELYTGVLGNDNAWVQKVIKAGKKAGENAWQLPLIQEYKKGLTKSPADLANIGVSKAGSITASLFLEEFVGGTKWAHMDIAGTATLSEPIAYCSKGATGNPVRTFLYLLMDW